MDEWTGVLTTTTSDELAQRSASPLDETADDDVREHR